MQGLGVRVGPGYGAPGSLEWLVAAIFNSGVEGYFADPADLTTAYQDSAGTTAGAVDQPVGLRLDKSDGAVRGAELWSDAAVSFTQASRISPNVYRINSPDGTYSGVSINAVLTADRRYEVTFTIDSITVLGAGLQVESVESPSFTTTGPKRCVVTASSTAAVIKRAGTACDIQISKVSFRELPGNHATQSTAASRPLLKSINGYLWEEFDGTDDFLTSATGGGGTTGFFYCGPVYVAGGAGTARVLWSDRGTTAGYGVFISAGNVLSLIAGNGLADTTVSTAATLPVGEAHIVTAWDDGTNLNVQIDNGTIASTARPAVAAGTAGFTEGRENGVAGSYAPVRLGTREYMKNYSPDSATREQIKRFVALRNGIDL